MGNHWTGLKFEGVDCNRDAVGTRIRWSAGGKEFQRFKTAGVSYLASYDPREGLGLAKALKAD